MDKSEQMKELYDKYIKEFSENEIVLGEGNLNARLLLIGEAPGKDEVRMSRPFVGMAGKNLSEFLEGLGINRESIYITNVIKYRLSKINPSSGRTVNRPATKKEIKQAHEYLAREVEIINPEYIVTLGNVPLRAVTGNYSINIGDVHGQILTAKVNQKDYKLFALYHPASIIYNQSLKAVYLKDIENLKALMVNGN